MRQDPGTTEGKLICWAAEDFPNAVSTQEMTPGDFPGGPIVKNLPFNAGDVGWVPGQGTKILYAIEQQIPHATTEVHAQNN